MNCIKKIKLLNFKRFIEFEIEFDPKMNIIIGDNEAGKSSILQAIELLSSGSRHKVESVGLESLLNKTAISDFFKTDRSFEKLPEVHIEAYFSDETNPDLFGKHNTDKTNSSGLHMIYQPNEDLINEINQLLADGSENFPFEFYTVKFITFNGEAYTGYRRFLKCLTIDSTKINSENANKEYIRTIYDSTVDLVTRIGLQNEYRQQKLQFKEKNFKTINDELGEYEFTVRTGSKFNLETDITLTQDNIPIDERGKGRQCFIKTEFALSRNSEKRTIDVLLLEEPENHLSHSNMKLLVSKISNTHQNQIIIATHSSLISARLDLRKSILINSSSKKPVTLKNLSNSTAKFFMKAPDNNILELVLSSKVILVEGDAEYMLIDAMYSKETGSSLENENVHVISVGGTSFKRYMELARELGIRTAVIRDNDKDYQVNCVENYIEHVSDKIKVFSDEDTERYTFEVCLYQDNKAICDAMFSGGRISKTPLEFMLSHKAESAFQLLDNYSELLTVPDYIKRAITWINE
ncbi:ATP-dependent endonuclease [Aeromonas allosaccharophila]|uniref:ATP-dependent nuclease n=1 Tax=Aeromonas allosaccharophila TaxID=656 RepID=UPI0005B1EE3D|nr:TOPRIM nucleotidyl transferase/hydrolase domain-containing protein [Aeromonas allosaccharophila]OKP43288.1 ATP-dependent endonuclease [Aeromonas allosaccharophila]